MIRINKDLCTGCGACVSDCISGVLSIIQGKAMFAMSVCSVGIVLRFVLRLLLRFRFIAMNLLNIILRPLIFLLKICSTP